MALSSVNVEFDRITGRGIGLKALLSGRIESTPLTVVIVFLVCRAFQR